jgi:hypothetical protein
LKNEELKNKIVAVNIWCINIHIRIYVFTINTDIYIYV